MQWSMTNMYNICARTSMYTHSNIYTNTHTYSLVGDPQEPCQEVDRHVRRDRRGRRQIR